MASLRKNPLQICFPLPPPIKSQCREERDMGFKPLKLEDFADINTNQSRWDILLDIAKRAHELCEQETKEKQSTRKSSLRKRSRVTTEEGESSKRRNTHKGNKQLSDAGPRPPPPLPENFQYAIRVMAGGRRYSPARLVIQKRLSLTDVSEGHSRLSMPLKRLENLDFLTGDEILYLSQRDGGSTKTRKLDVGIIEPCLLQSEACFRRWDMGNVDCIQSTSAAVASIASRIQSNHSQPTSPC